MRKIIFYFSLMFIALNSTLNAQENNIVPGNIIVMFNSDTDVSAFLNSFQNIEGIETGIKINEVLSKSMHIYLFDFDPLKIDQEKFLNLIKLDPAVKIAQFNHTFITERSIPNDPNYSNQWNMNNTGQSGGTADADIDAPEAWDITTGGLTSQNDTIVVAVIDVGFDLAHQDLNFWKNRQEIAGNHIDDDGNGYIDDVKGWNAGSNNDNITSAQHGTHISGIVGAKGNNGIGVTGVNWNVKVMAISYGSSGSGSAFEANVVKAYGYVMEQRKLYNQTNGSKGAFVVSTNSSFGVNNGQPSAYPLWCAMYDSLGSVGILSAGATVNANLNIDVQGDIPTACPSNWLITVTNTTSSDFKYSGCGYGATTIDLGAPGTMIWSTLPGNTYGGSTWTGTSQATPHVAGAIALMYSVACPQFITNYKANPSAIALMVKDSLLNATDPISDLNGITVTGGRLNLFKSVRAMQNYCAAVSVPENGSIDQSFEIINAYPNPATNMLNVVYNSDEEVNINIVNILGEEVIRMKGEISKGIQYSHINLNSFEKGIYFISIESKTRKSNVIKVIVY